VACIDSRFWGVFAGICGQSEWKQWVLQQHPRTRFMQFIQYLLLQTAMSAQWSRLVLHLSSSLAATPPPFLLMLFTSNFVVQ